MQPTTTNTVVDRNKSIGMLSKLICAAVISAAAAAGHSIQSRQAVYTKVNRDSEYGAPSAPAYSAPSYSAPAPSYSAPAPSYSAPAPSYGAPAPSYSAPEASYGAPSYGSYEEEGGFDLTSIIIPILALIGLSLLFPTYVSLTSVKRKRREAGDFEGNTHGGSPFYLQQHTSTLNTTLHYTTLQQLHNVLQQICLRPCSSRWSRQRSCP